MLPSKCSSARRLPCRQVTSSGGDVGPGRVFCSRAISPDLLSYCTVSGAQFGSQENCVFLLVLSGHKDLGSVL